MKIILARHGETPWNAAGRYQGQIDIPLSETGEAQAAKLGDRLRDVTITRAVSSQLARARSTAEAALGENRKHILRIDPRLQEIAHGDWEGLLAQEIAERDPVTFQGLNPPGPEASIGYTIPNLLIDHAMRNPPIRPGFWRGVNVNHNAIYMECFMDELALSVGQDPVEFRRKLMAWR